MITALIVIIAIFVAFSAWFWVSIVVETRRIQRMRDDVAIKREVDRAKRLGWLP